MRWKMVGLNLGDEVTVVADPEHRWIVVAPAEETLPSVRPNFVDRVDRFIERYQPALEALAKE
jgi:hypothetical protein